MRHFPVIPLSAGASVDSTLLDLWREAQARSPNAARAALAVHPALPEALEKGVFDAAVPVTAIEEACEMLVWALLDSAPAGYIVVTSRNQETGGTRVAYVPERREQP